MQSGQKTIQVIVVDDHSLFRSGVKAGFDSHHDICVTGEADCGSELFRILATTPADIILLDVMLPDMSGIEITRRLRIEYPDIKILAVSADNSAQTVKDLIESGINGFVSKQQSESSELAVAVRIVMSGVEYFGRDISSIIYDIYVAKKQTTAVTPEFTDRERDVIHACRDGLAYNEIAEKLEISAHTVNTHKKNIFKKLGINNTMEMVKYALIYGIIQVKD